MNFQKILLFCLFFITQKAFAAGKFEFSPLARNAYDKVLSLRFGEAQAQINQLKKNEPNNLIVHYIENYMDGLRIFINEDKAEFDRLKQNEEKRLEAVKAGDSKSPYYLLVQAEIQLMWAINRVKFGEYISALNEVSSAYGQLEANQAKFPTFVANKKCLGIMHAVVGSVPDNYKWGVKLVSGLNGTLQQGLGEIEEVIKYSQKNPDFVFGEEVLVLYSFMMLHLNNDNESAWSLINSSTKLKPKENPLACFVIANVAMRTGRNDKAIEILQNKPTGQQFHPCHYLDFMLGLAKLYRGDSDADTYLKKFANNFKGRNYLKEVNQKLAWEALISGNAAGYKSYIALCKTQGKSEIGGDKNALKEAKSGIAPDVTLLKARLQFDGGYYQKAYDGLSGKKASDFKNEAQQLEFSYRMGRILQMLKKPNDAVQFYNQTLQAGKNKPYYFACNAALQMGTIYEESKQYGKSREFYNYCLNLSPDDYADALHAKAKAGINRIKGKKG